MRKEEIALELYNSAKENGFLDTIYEVIGPKVISLRGGMGGTYVKTTGESGEAKLVVKAEGLETMEIVFTVE